MSNAVIEKLVDEMGEFMSRGKVLEEFNRSGRGELFVLKYLYNKNVPATPSELSEALDSSTARISAALGTLEKKGQIHREIDISNRRFILVTITESGRERIHFFMQQMRENLVQILTAMGEQDAKEFVRLSRNFFESAQRIMPATIECENRPHASISTE